MKRAVVCLAVAGPLLAGCSHPPYALEIEASGPCQFGAGLTGPFYGTNHVEAQVLDPHENVARTATMVVHIALEVRNHRLVARWRSTGRRDQGPGETPSSA